MFIIIYVIYYVMFERKEKEWFCWSILKFSWIQIWK